MLMRVTMLAGAILTASPASGEALLSRDVRTGVVHTYSRWESRSAVRSEGQWTLIDRIDVSHPYEFVAPVFCDSLGGSMFPTGTILLRTSQSSGTVQKQVDAIWPGGGVVRESEGVRDVYTVTLTSCADGADVLAVVELLAASGHHHWVEPELQFTGRKSLVPTDPEFPLQWHLLNSGQTGGLSGFDLNLPEAWEITTGDPSVIVAIFDDGVEYDHPDLNGIAGLDVTGQTVDGAPFEDADDHGTAIAGVISARLGNSQGVVGIAPDCLVMPVRIGSGNNDSSDFTTSQELVASAIEQATIAGATIGCHGYELGFNSNMINDAFADARAGGVLHIAASGNRGDPITGFGAPVVSYPAYLPTVLSVGGVGANGLFDPFANYGADLDLVAPSTMIRTVDATVLAASRGFNGGNTTTQSGSSYSAAMVAGVAALVCSEFPSADPETVLSILFSTSTDLGAPGRDDDYGVGMPDAGEAVARASILDANKFFRSEFEARCIDVGDAPQGVAIGDLDGDGDADVVVGNSGDDNVSVLLNIGGGVLTPHPSVQTGGSPRSLVLGDLDGDGDLDLAVANFDDDDVSVLFNDGQGAFGLQAQVPVGDGPQGIACGHLNGDGVLDLVTANALGSGVSILLGNGDGTFVAAPPVSMSSPYNVTIADLNGDLVSDIAVTLNLNNPGAVGVVLGNGDGTFSSVSQHPVGRNPLGIAAGDLNGDAIADIAVANSGEATNETPIVSVIMSDGSAFSIAAGASPRSIVIVDSNGDGALDLVSTNQASDDVSVILNTGDGAFADQALVPVGDIPISIAAGDLTGDGSPDLAVVNAADDDVSVLVNNSASNVRFEAGDVAWEVSVGDLDGDGDVDVVVPNSNSNDLTVLLNDGTGAFLAEQRVPVGQFPRNVKIVDLDDDGDLDLVVPNRIDDSISILWNDGSASFVAGPAISVGDEPNDVQAGDLNGDGLLDLVAVNNVGGNVSILLNDGAGAFLLQPDAPGVNAFPYSVTIADLDGDGDLDLGVANTISCCDGNVSLLFNNGDGTFGPQQVRDTGWAPTRIGSADLDADGDVDLVVANNNSESVSILFNDGGGGFAPEVRVSTGMGPRGLVLDDLNGDGVPDLAVSNDDSDDVSVRLGLGDGRFTPEARFRVGDRPMGITASDLDGDLAPDLVIGNRDANQLSILFNVGESGGQVSEPTGSCLSDLDGDGVVDVADLLHFLAVWFSAVSAADVDASGVIDIRDLLLFLEWWLAPAEPC